ncbi:hypothetical protein [Achromobacter animicus]|uniref:hypothetical protein n=1 Tax=Achromobacter animicus TaxID=1389935 RepID=UPI0024496331|nr:hypothetical protein [Achromobacter animicus]MDH0682872.1 hypothetical protein [Achromobacter animicus]
MDDDPQNLAGLSMLFESWGCRVIAATSGNALLERVYFDEQKRFRQGTQAAQVIDYFTDNFHKP